eukprot:2265631-Amphidinium_carterae.1
MEQTFQQMSEQMQQLITRQATLEGQLAQAQAQVQAAGANADPNTHARVDLRLLGKPHGDPDKWKEWCTVFRGYTAAALPRFEAHVDQVISVNAPVLNAALDADVATMSKQLHWM